MHQFYIHNGNRDKTVRINCISHPVVLTYGAVFFTSKLDFLPLNTHYKGSGLNILLICVVLQKVGGV